MPEEASRDLAPFAIGTGEMEDGAGVARVAEEPLPDIKLRQRRPVILLSIFSARAPQPSGHPGWMARVENTF